MDRVEVFPVILKYH